MNEVKSKQELLHEFQQLDRELSTMIGYHYVMKLWDNVQNPISPTDLYCSFQKAITDDFSSDPKPLFLPEVGYTVSTTPSIPFPLTDRKALCQIRAAAKATMQNLETAKLDGDTTMVNYFRNEMAMMYDYISHSLNKSGRIKQPLSINRKHQLLIYRAVQKFCNKLHESHPELADYICAHIVIRMKCYWSEVPIKRKV